MKRAVLVLGLGLALAAPAALAQVDVSLQVGATKYAASGQGECKAAPRASIYGVPAALYSVSQRSASGSLSLTLWQPGNQPEMMSLQVSVGRKSYTVDTVKAGSKRDTQGSGKAKLEKSGAGGTIVIDAVAAGGEKIAGRIECRSFGAVHAEGG